MSLPEPASFRISEDDHYALNKLMFNRTLKPLKIFLLALLPIVALSIIIDVALKRSIIDDLMPLGVGGLVGCFAVFVMSASLKRNARKVYRESASLQEEMTLVFEEDGFRIEQQSGSWRVEWRQLVRWDEDGNLFAVFPNRRLAIIIPKEQVGEELVDFVREKMRQSGLLKPWKLRE